MVDDFDINELFEGFEDDTEELYRQRTRQYNLPKQKPTRMQQDASIDELFEELDSDSHLKFRHETLNLSKDCNQLAEKFARTHHENLLLLKAKRVFRGKKIFDTLQLNPEYGNLYQMTFANLTFDKYNPTRVFRGEPLILPTKRGNFLVPRKRVEQIVKEMLKLVKEKVGGKSFRINNTNYFSFLQTTKKRPFLMGTYYCSKQEKFILE